MKRYRPTYLGASSLSSLMAVSILVKAKVNCNMLEQTMPDIPTVNASERHISKRGNSYLRKTGYEIMQCLIQHKPVDPPVYGFIQKKRSDGKCAKEAMIAGLNKLLSVSYCKVSEVYNTLDEKLIYGSNI